MSAVKPRALITGAAAGLGKAFAEQLVAGGWDVVAVDRDADGLRLLLVELGEQVSTILADLSTHQNVDALLDVLLGGSHFDLVIHNAGISATGRFEDIPSAGHERLLQVNVHAPIRMTNALLAGEQLNKSARVLFISSLSHAVGYPGAASYGASKDAIASYGASLRQKLEPFGIKVCVAFPGPLKTDHAERHAPEGADSSKRMAPEVAAKIILGGVRSGRGKIYPGMGAKAFAVMGRIAPGLSAKLMKLMIYNKLDKPVAD